MDDKLLIETIPLLERKIYYIHPSNFIFTHDEKALLTKVLETLEKKLKNMAAKILVKHLLKI